MQLFPLIFSGKKKYSIILPALAILISIILVSCATSKNANYFQTLSKDTIIKGFVSNNFESKIQKKDVLSIKISSLSREMDEAFNIAAGAISENAVSIVADVVKGYMVDQNGNILLHYLGPVHVEGLTRNELKIKLQHDLLPFMKEPIAGIEYLNHKITILGYVAQPQVLTMPGEQIPLFDVIVHAGGLKDNALTSDVMIIRERDSTKEVKHINLENHSIFTSPWYYLQPNDIVYILPDKTSTDKEERRRRLQTTLSLVASGISLIIIIINTLIK